MVKTARCDPKKLRPEDFRKLELRVGKIRAVKKHGQEYVILVDMGAVEQDVQIVADLRYYPMKSLIGKYVVVLLNICSQTVAGVESTGMLLMADSKGKPVFITPEKKIHCLGVRVYGKMNGDIIHG